MVSESKTTGVTFPYERQAMNGEEMPDGLSFPDQILYLQLRLLYDSLRKGIVSRDIATKEKKKLLDEYRIYKYREQMGEHWVQVIRDTELARADYCKNRTLENADKLVAIVEGRSTEREAIRRMLEEGLGFRPLGSANGQITHGRCWKSIGRECPGGGT